ncbi:MAG: MFS transporter [Chloroflexota bacterium]
MVPVSAAANAGVDIAVLARTLRGPTVLPAPLRGLKPDSVVVNKQELQRISTKSGPKVFYGWWVLLAACVSTFYLSGAYWWGFSVFIPAILDEFGWSRSQISLALTHQGLEGIGLAPAIGLLVDRVGTRRLMLFGLSIAGLGFILLSMTHSLVWFYGAYVLVSLGASTGAGIVTQSLIVRWFRRRRGPAITALAVMPGLGATAIIPLLNLSIEGFGWRETFLIIGVVLWVIAVPVLLVVRSSPEEMGLEPDGGLPPTTGLQGGNHRGEPGQNEHGFTLREALRLPAFWFLAAAVLIWNLATSGVQLHLFVALKGFDTTRSLAAAAATLLPALSLIGRIVFGLLSDLLDKRYLLFMAGSTMAAGMACLTALMLNPSLTWLLIPFLLLFSVGFGGSIPVRVVICGHYFGRKHFPLVYGVFQSIAGVGGVVGPILAGGLFDTTGSYFIAFAVVSVLVLVSLPLVLLTSNPQSGAAVLSAEGPKGLGSA